MSASEPRRGAYLERQTQAHLQANGYWTMKAPGSKGAVDVVAIKPCGIESCAQILFIQCKLNGVMPPAERAALWDVADEAGAWPLMVKRDGPGSLTWWRLVARVGAPLAVWVPFEIDEVA